MNEDIRLKIGFFDHPKTKKLEKRLGLKGIKCLLRLWMFTAQNKPEGILTNMNAEDIELSCSWEGKTGLFIETITEKDCLWLEEANGVYKIHDWADNNPYAAHARERQENARAAASTRWNKKHGVVMPTACQQHAESIQTAMPDSEKSNAPLPVPIPLPVPDPIPDPEPPPKPKKEKILRFTSEDMKLSSLLWELMVDNKPDRRPLTEKQLDDWANTVRLMRERDNRKPEDIETLIKWSQNDKFWKNNIESMGTLRDKFDRLSLQSQKSNTPDCPPGYISRSMIEKPKQKPVIDKFGEE